MRSLFDDAVTAHGETVWRVCAAVLGPGADAEDAWSETFVSLLRAWVDLPDSTNVEAWLVRVARRRAVDVVRARRAVPLSALPDPAATAVVPVGEHWNDELWDDELWDDELWDAVAALPDRQREAVALHVVAGFRHTETARATGSSPAAVRRAYADGIRALRKVLPALGLVDLDPPARTDPARTDSARTDPAPLTSEGPHK